MNFFNVSSSIQAAQIAAEEEKQLQDEEETMTTYSSEDLADDWEFKILRSATSAFKKPEVLRSILDQEAKAGWILVEKFDDTRVRLKRPASAKRDDRHLGFDPYRTQIGMPGAILGFAIVFTVIALVLVGVFAVAVLND